MWLGSSVFSITNWQSSTHGLFAGRTKIYDSKPRKYFIIFVLELDVTLQKYILDYKLGSFP